MFVKQIFPHVQDKKKTPCKQLAAVMYICAVKDTLMHRPKNCPYSLSHQTIFTRQKYPCPM